MKDKAKTLEDLIVKGNYNYPAETLTNGNITHCIEYLQEISRTGTAGQAYVFDALTAIKEQCADRYKYVKGKVFSINRKFK
jgi:hypothetical protein